jgi:hypothetical protein
MENTGGFSDHIPGTVPIMVLAGIKEYKKLMYTVKMWAFIFVGIDL